MRAATWEKDPEKQKELFDKVNEELIQPHVEKIEKHMTENGTGFLVGNAVSESKRKESSLSNRAARIRSRGPTWLISPTSRRQS